MARSSKKPQKGVTSKVAPQKASSTKATPVTADSYLEKKGGAAHWSTKNWIILYVSVFVVVQLIILFAFTGLGGEKRPQAKMLARAESQFEEQRYEASLKTLLDFGERWPGAYGTREFEWKLGERYYNMGEYEKAAEHYINSVNADPSFRDTRALAGRSLWKAGKREEAVRWFRDELAQGSAENDIAHYYLGRVALDQGEYVEAYHKHRALRRRIGPRAKTVGRANTRSRAGRSSRQGKRRKELISSRLSFLVIDHSFITLKNGILL